MLVHYFKTAWRHLKGNRSYTVINIAGLALSAAIAIVIFCVVRFETGFDQYKHADRIYQIYGQNMPDDVTSSVPTGVIRALNNNFPGVEQALTVYRHDPQVIRIGEKNMQQQQVYFAAPAILDLTDVQWIEGSSKTSLNGLYQAVIDEPTAQRLFGGNAMGKTFNFDNRFEVTVTGVIKQMPSNSSFPFQMVLSLETLKKYNAWLGNDDYWGGGESYFHGYVLLKPGTNAAAVEAGLNRLLQQHKKSKEDYPVMGYRVRPLAESHFNTDLDYFNYATPHWLLFAISSIALFLVLIASINFINMATVQALQRNRQTGIRKILGSGKGIIVLQFYIETGIITLLSMVIALLLAYWMLPFVPDFIPTRVTTDSLWSVASCLFILSLALLLIVFTGTYPAFVLSGFKPIQLIRNRFFTPPAKGISLRQSLVVTQFVIAQVLVLCTVVGIKQVNFFYRKDLGFDKKDIVTVNMPNAENRELRGRLRQQLLQQPGITDVTYGLSTPSSLRTWWWTTMYHHSLEGGSHQEFRMQFIDSNYFQFFHIPLVAGRSFRAADSSASIALINEEAAHLMGFKNAADAIGENFKNNGDQYQVAGIAKNYNSQSLRSNVPPHVYFYNQRNFQTLCVRIDPAQQKAALQHIEAAWKEAFPAQYFEYTFLDESLKEFYSDENKLARFLSVLSMVAIFIGCLGVYGLISFICVRKTKEIGIRKVLGAGITQILSMLTREFLLLILVAALIAMPLAWYIMHSFLADYTYRIPIPWWLFVLCGAGALLITLLTISFQTVKAANANPVQSLRTE